MLIIDIPGFKTIEAEHLVLDYNGTLAIDGNMIGGVRTLLERLSESLTIHIITADTFGKLKSSVTDIPCHWKILPQLHQDIGKEQYVKMLGNENVIAIGNGSNDALMLKSAALAIALVQTEGASVRTIFNAHIVCHSVIDALELLLNPLRLIATLRS